MQGASQLMSEKAEKSWLRPFNFLTAVVSMAVIGLAGWVAWRPYHFARATGFDYPLGPDPTLWGKAAVLARYDSPQTLPPAFPEFAALLATDDSLVQGALAVNAISLFILTVLAAVGAALLATDRWTALAAAVGAAAVTGLCSHVFPSVYYFQPDMMTLASLTGVVAAAAYLARGQNKASALLYGAAIGVAFSVREHGIVVLLAGLIAFAFVIRRGRRLRLWFFLLLGLQLGGGISSGVPHMPFFWPHGSPSGTITKASVAFRDTLALSNNSGSEQELSGGLQRDKASSKPFLESMRTQAMTKGKDFIPLFVLSFGGLLALVRARGWRAALLSAAALSPLAASLLFWTQWRHFFVVSGGAVVIAVGGFAALSGKTFPRLGSILILGFCGFHVWQWAPYQSSMAASSLQQVLQDQQKKSKNLELARKVRELSTPGTVLEASDPVIIMSGMQPIRLKASEKFFSEPPSWPSFVYRTVVISSNLPGPMWEELSTIGNTGIYRLQRPEGITEACLYGVWSGVIVENIPHDKERLVPKMADGCL